MVEYDGIWWNMGGIWWNMMEYGGIWVEYGWNMVEYGGGMVEYGWNMVDNGGIWVILVDNGG